MQVFSAKSMEVKFDSFDFPIEIPTSGLDKRKLTIKQHPDVDSGIAFRINMGEYTLVRVYTNGDIVLHTEPYPGRDYHYKQLSYEGGETRFSLVPSKVLGEK